MIDLTILRPKSAGETLCNCRIKYTPKGEVLEACVASRPIFNPGYETLEGAERAERGSATEEGRKRAARRAKKRLFELAMCNELDTFITLTLDGKQIDRYDIRAVTKKLNVWLDNRVRRKGLKYLLVAEAHKDGAIHFHGLVNGEALKLEDSGHRDKKGRKVFNVTDWKWGCVTTAVRVDKSYKRVCHYVSKYITKQQGEKGPLGGRYFYHGGALEEPKVEYYQVGEFPGGGKKYDLEEAGLTLRYY